MAKADPHLLQARFTPPLSDLPMVDRHRLTARLSESTARKLTLVTAPAGYGKTTLLALAHREMVRHGTPAAWLTIDRDETDFMQFARSILGAIQTARPEFGRSAAALLQAGIGITDRAILLSLANELSGVPESLYLFLDDAHELSATRALPALRALITGTPPNIHFVISSRSEIDIGIGRLRATGQLDEIGWTDLRFSTAETQQYFSKLNDIQLDSGVADRLLSKTEGWAAGIQLVSLAIKNTSDIANLVDRITGDNRGIAEYLAEDVLKYLDSRTRDFILKISPLRRFSPALCQRVTGIADAEEILQALEAANLFIFPVDQARNWYRFHSLFSEFLKRQLEKSTPKAVNRIRLEASAWLEEQGFYDEAVEYAFQAGDSDYAARLIDRHAYDLWRAGHQSRLNGWAGRIPALVRGRYPLLRLIQAWALMTAGRIQAAENILVDVKHQMGLDKDDPEEAGIRDDNHDVIGDVLFVRLMLAYFGDDPERCEALGRRWLEGTYTPDPFLQGAALCLVANSRGLMFDLDYARRHAADISQLFQEAETQYGTIWSLSIMGATFLMAGFLDEAAKILNEALAVADSVGGKGSPLAAMPAMLMAELSYESDDLEAARGFLQDYQGGVGQLSFLDHIISWYTVQARLRCAADGQLKDALVVLDERGPQAARSVYQSSRLRASLVLEKLRILTLLGRPADVLELARMEGLTGPIEDYMPEAGQDFRALRLAQGRMRALLAEGAADQCLSLARKWLHLLRECDLPRPEIQFRILAALAYLALEDTPAAQRELRDAIRLGARHNIVRDFLDEPKALRAAVARTCSAMEVTDPEFQTFCRALRARLPEVASKSRESEQREMATEDLPNERPTRRELEVLRLVASGLSNRQIGDALGLTENTVKWNLQQLYQKFGVHKRLQAIERARRLGLLTEA